MSPRGGTRKGAGRKASPQSKKRVGTVYLSVDVYDFVISCQVEGETISATINRLLQQHSFIPLFKLTQ